MGIIDNKIEEAIEKKFPEQIDKLRETINLGVQSAEKRQKDFDSMMIKFQEAILRGKEIEERFEELIEKKLKQRGL